MDRNPSPPKEFQEVESFRQDMIGATTISKKWVFSTLMDMCKEVDKHNTENDEEVVDVSDELQDSVCRLWDLCIDGEVAKFLIDSKAIGIFCGILLKSKSPRLNEIVIGILGNMACTSESCQALSTENEMRALAISLLSCRDTPTLIQVVRLINTCLMYEDCRDMWLNTIESQLDNILQDIVFILNSSTNIAVLKNVLEIFDTCVDIRPSLLNDLSDAAFCNAVTEAVAQILKDENVSKTAYGLHLLYSLTESTNAVDIFSSNRRMLNILIMCCGKWRESDDFSAEMKSSVTAIASCLSVINFIVINSNSEQVNSLEAVSLQDRNTLCIFSSWVMEKCKELNIEKPGKIETPKTETKHVEESHENDVEIKKLGINGNFVKESQASESSFVKNEIVNQLIEISEDLSQNLVKIGWKI